MERLRPASSLLLLALTVSLAAATAPVSHAADIRLYTDSAKPDTTLTTPGGQVALQAGRYYNAFRGVIHTPPGAGESARLLLPDTGLVILLDGDAELSFEDFDRVSDANLGEVTRITVRLSAGTARFIAPEGADAARISLNILATPYLVQARESFIVAVFVGPTGSNRTSVSVVDGTATVRSEANAAGPPLAELASGDRFPTSVAPTTDYALLREGAGLTGNESAVLRAVANTIRANEAGINPLGEPLPAAISPAEAVSASFKGP